MQFHLFPTPEIIFGKGKLTELPQIINRYGSSVLIITGGSSFRASKEFSWLKETLNKQSIQFSTESLEGEPSTNFVDQVTNQYRGKNIDAVVSIGGGSPIDAGKAISAMLPVDGSVEDYLEGVGTKEHPGVKVPFIAASTSSGTGSEATFNAVISRIGANGYKKSLRHSNLMPNIALIDPTLTVSCPPHITASSGMDAFTQLLEAYLSTAATPITDAITFDALKLIPHSLEKAFADGTDITARSNMAYASLVSGIALANAGLGVVHGYASPIGGFFAIPHGVVCGTLLPAATRVTIEKLLRTGENPSAINKYASVGKLFSDTTGETNKFYCNKLISELYSLADALELPKLSQYGIGEEDLQKIAENTGSKNNPVRLTPDELMVILKERL